MTVPREVTRLGLAVVVVTFFIVASTAAVHHRHAKHIKRPHILVIVADDMGWNDVGFRDSEMYTPNIDKMASEGMMLNYSYMQQVCTPSRAAFLTGIYPFRMGLQTSVFTAMQNRSLPLQYELLPHKLRTLGYKTHMVGKWHLGFCNHNMTPTYRGFDTFYGMYNGKGDYFTHLSKQGGYDMHNDVGPNLTVDWSAKGIYSTHLFTDKTIEILKHHKKSHPAFILLSYQAVHVPLQVPQYYVDKYCANVTTGEARKLHCAMTAAMDEGIGNVTAALDRLGFSDNLITLFISGNGGQIDMGSSNWPLRGTKRSLWEGGTRVVTVLHSKTYLRHHKGYVWDGLMHAVDWYPTLMRAAGHTDPGDISGIDGVNNWGSILKKHHSHRKEFVYNIDDVKNTSAIRYRKYKLINNNPNNPGEPDGWYNPPAGVANKTQPSGKYPEYMLFDIEQDPEEDNDISGEGGETQKIMQKMKKKLAGYKLGIQETVQPKKVKAGNPKYHNGTWVSGWC